jgi:PAS domain S-box-containing protein
MSSLDAMGADVATALESVSVPSYVIDTFGIIRWLNPAAKRLVGDCRGRQFTSVVASEDRKRSRDVFAQKVSGTRRVTDASVALIGVDGDRLACEVSSVPLMQGGHVVGVFGQVPQWQEQVDPIEHPRLTPRQAEVLHMLEHGRSTVQIATELHLSQETVRNHVRHLLRAMGVNSRLEAVAAARRHRHEADALLANA